MAPVTPEVVVACVDNQALTASGRSCPRTSTLACALRMTTISFLPNPRTAAAHLVAGDTRWRLAEIEALFELPFMDLLFRAQQAHREHFDASEVQLSTLLSIKTGGCPEDCGYCPQSAHFDTGVEASKLMPLQEVVEAAQAAKAQGATRFCMARPGAAPRRATWSA